MENGIEVPYIEGVANHGGEPARQRATGRSGGSSYPGPIRGGHECRATIGDAWAVAPEAMGRLSLGQEGGELDPQRFEEA